MADWYKTHSLSPEAYPESEYLEWAQDNGATVDAAGNVHDMFTDASDYWDDENWGDRRLY